MNRLRRVLALAPGFTRTERVAAALDAAGNKEYCAFTESPGYAGRAVVGLARDSKVLDK